MISLEKKYTFTLLCLISLLCIVAWEIQAHLLLNWDVSWDLLASERLLAGGSYTHDFFDLNPPLIFYVYAPSVFIAQFFSINTTLALRLYIFALSFLSLRLCQPLLHLIFAKESRRFAQAILLVLVFIFLILPNIDFGEREHLLVIFTCPYFLMMACRLQKKTIDSGMAITIGAFSFMGFALKPYFLIAFLLTELLTMIYTRDRWCWLRREVITILTLLMLYVGVILIGYPDYLSLVVPLARRFYYVGFHCSWMSLLNNIPLFFCVLAGLCYLVQYKNNPYQRLCTLLMLAMMGFFTAYFIQQTNWAYHLFPAFAMALLMMSVLFGTLVMNRRQNIPLMGFVAVIFFSIPLTYIDDRVLYGIEYKQAQQPLTTFLQTHAAQQPVYFITASPRQIFPTVTTANAIYASRLLHLFWVPAIVKNKHSPHPEALSSKEAKKDEMTFIDMVADDIEQQKAKFIFVDIQPHKQFFLADSFEYLPYLLKNKHFQTAFKCYQYLTTIESYTDQHLPNDTLQFSEYKFAIYARQDTSPTRAL